MSRKKIIFFMWAFSLLSALITGELVFAGDEAGASESSISPTRFSYLIHKTLVEKMNRPNLPVEIRLPSFEKLVVTAPINQFQNIESVRLLEDRPSGVAVFEAYGKGNDGSDLRASFTTPYEAWVKVPVANRRIYPNKSLKNEDFKIELVNIASGPAREFRGVLVPASTNFTHTESKQTILEGQWVTANAFQNEPDVRAGDVVRLELNSGDLVLTTEAVAQEAGSFGGRVRVLSVKTKKEFSGIVKNNRAVEVNL